MNEQENKPKPWNGSDRSYKIGRRILLDWIAGIGAAFMATPIIMAIDKSVVQNASGTQPMMASLKDTGLKLIKNPIKFCISREFGWIFFVYGSTYMAANSIDSLCNIYQASDVFPKLIGVTAVNMTASILKDRAFAYYYGKKVTNKVGMISLAIWLLRDVLTITGAFVLPSRLASTIKKTDVEEATAKKMIQFILPIGFQVFLTPLHLLGYDFYNYKDRMFFERLLHVKKVYGSSVGIRMVRMGAAYGIGGNYNFKFRDNLISKFEGKNWNKQY